MTLTREEFWDARDALARIFWKRTRSVPIGALTPYGTELLTLQCPLCLALSAPITTTCRHPTSGATEVTSFQTSNWTCPEHGVWRIAYAAGPCRPFMLEPRDMALDYTRQWIRRAFMLRPSVSTLTYKFDTGEGGVIGKPYD